MTFTVEDGTGLAAANSYLSVADFQAYHDDRGGDYSAYSDTQIEQALVRTTDYVDDRWQFVGHRRSTVQALEWPRIGAYATDGRLLSGVPVDLEEAVAEYALRALAANLAPDPTYTATNGTVTSSSSKVGPIETAVTYRSGGQVVFRTYPTADAKLKPITRSSRELIRL